MDKYNVLWIDDEHVKMGSTKGRFKRSGIILNAFKSLNAGMVELESNQAFYDAVLLDARMYLDEDDVKGSEDEANVIEAQKRILQMDKRFEIFVLTGQPDLYDNSLFSKTFDNIYSKGLDEDIERLMIDLKEAGSRQEDVQVRHKYQKVFDVCTEQYIGVAASRALMMVLKNMESQEFRFLNELRKIVEDLFQSFAEKELLPYSFTIPNMQLNAASRFLSGYHNKQKPELNNGYIHLHETHLPSVIANSLRFVLDITQEASHRLSVDEHQNTSHTTFLRQSVVYALMDVLVWYKGYVDTDPQTNNWKKSK